MKVQLGKNHIYISTKQKFLISLLVATLWFSFSFYISRPWLADLSHVAGDFLAYFIIISIALIPGFMNILLIIGLLLDRQPQLIYDGQYPPISILIASYNEEEFIEETLKSIENQDYPAAIEIVIVDDGSTDGSIEIIEDYEKILVSSASRFDSTYIESELDDSSLMVKTTEKTIQDYGKNYLKLIKAKHGGKANALNVGIKEVSNEIIVTMDADTFLHKEAIKRIVTRYMIDPSNTAAIAGSVLVKNSRKNFMTKLQENDYFLAIASVKRQQGLFQGTLVAQGAFSLYKKEAVEEVSGWPNVIGEDIVVTWALLKKGYRVGYEPTAVGFTNVPTNYKQFAKQRRRWARGMIEGLKHHIDLIYKRKNMSAFLVTMNLFFPVLDISYVLFFIPGIILAFFGYYWIVGLYTLAVLPLTFGIMSIMFRYQRRVFSTLGLKVRRNIIGFVLYALIYQFLMSPVTVWGYLEEFSGVKKKW